MQYNKAESRLFYTKALHMRNAGDLTDIIDGCKSGNMEGFSRLVDVYAGRCYGYFYRLTGNREISDDLLGELFVRLVEKIGSYRGGSFDSWLFKVASNIFHDHLRAKQRQRKLLQSQRKRLESKAQETEYSGSAQIDKLQMALDRLDADTRELIMLRFYSELSFKEMAKMRSEPIGTTLAKVHRGLKRLRELME